MEFDPESDGPTFSYDDELRPGQFVMTQSWFIRAHGIPAEVKLLYQILASYAGAGVQAYPGQKRLMLEMGCKSTATFAKMLSRLEETGLIHVKRRGQGDTNLYHVHALPPDRHLPARYPDPFAGAPANKTPKTPKPGPELQKMKFRNFRKQSSSLLKTEDKLDAVESDADDSDSRAAVAPADGGPCESSLFEMEESPSPQSQPARPSGAGVTTGGRRCAKSEPPVVYEEVRALFREVGKEPPPLAGRDHFVLDACKAKSPEAWADAVRGFALEPAQESTGYQIRWFGAPSNYPDRWLKSYRQSPHYKPARTHYADPSHVPAPAAPVDMAEYEEKVRVTVARLDARRHKPAIPNLRAKLHLAPDGDPRAAAIRARLEREGDPDGWLERERTLRSQMAQSPAAVRAGQVQAGGAA